ncbi:MAG: thiamine-phosphate synthase family protein [Promethearchaeota archaeon]
MEWLLKEALEKKSKIPDIIWDKVTMGKEPMVRLFRRNSKEIIEKLKKIHVLIYI